MKLYTIILSIFLINTIFSLILYHYRRGITVITEPDDYEPTFFDVFYFSNVTFFTVGYGDILPTSSTTRLIIMFKMIITFLITMQFTNNNSLN